MDEVGPAAVLAEVWDDGEDVRGEGQSCVTEEGGEGFRPAGVCAQLVDGDCQEEEEDRLAVEGSQAAANDLRDLQRERCW